MATNHDLDRDELHRSVVLKMAPVALRPPVMPCCGSCPLGAWFLTKKALACFCSAFRENMWSTSKPEPVLACDAREAALDELVERMKQD